MRRSLPALAALLLASGSTLLTASCAAPPAPAADEAVEHSVMGMYQAFQQRNLEKVGTYMTADSTCYDATTSQLLVGRKAVLDHFGAILAMHKPGEKWESAVEGMDVTRSGDFALAKYRVRTSQGGDHNLAAVTHVFRNVDGRWLAVHLHRSWNHP